MNSMGSALRLIFEKVKQLGQVSTLKEFARELGTYSHTLNEMFKGQRPVTLKVLTNLHDKFNINVNFLLSAGGGEMFRRQFEKLDSSISGEIELAVLKNEVEHLRKEMGSKDKIIALLEKKGKNAIA